MIFVFGDCEIDSDQLELRRSGAVHAVEPQVFDLLLYLIENRERVVSKDDLFEAIWEGRVVSEANLSNRINLARRAIGDSGKKQDFIRTFPRRGFRFVGDVETRKSENGGGTPVTTAVRGAADSVHIDKPSIAVLPFDNLSGDLDQEYFADGLTNDIITALTHWRSFPVVSGDSTFAYKGKEGSARRAAEELGARYVLEGSVRKSGAKVRITTQLSDMRSGHHVWAEKFDRDIQDVFAVQDEITQNVASRLVPELERMETKRSAAKQPQNLDAWDCYLRGLSHLYETTEAGNARARNMFEQALELDPNYGPAFSGIGYLLSRDLILSHSASFDDTAARCLEAAERAVALDVSDSFASTVLVRALLWAGQHGIAITEANRALDLNPYNPQAYIWLGSALVFAGNQGEGIPHLETGLKLAPRDPRNNFFTTELALAYLTIGDTEGALPYARAAAERRTDFIESHLALAAVLAHLGEKSEAKAVLALVGISDCRSVEARIYWRFHKYPATKELVLKGLRKTGLPD